MTAPELRAAVCPVCAAAATAKRADTPYWICPSCSLWFQAPLPPKVYEAAHETPGDQMSEDDRAVNDRLAAWLVDDVLEGKPGPSLDIGAKYPYLASRLQARGCSAIAIDGIGKAEAFGEMLGVRTMQADLEHTELSWLPKLRLVTLVHCFEHLYDPLAAIRKLRRLVAEDGRVFIRSPDHGVRGIERDLTPGHFTIHPYVYTLSALLELLVRARDCFVVERHSALEPGQRDLVLRPIRRAPTIALGMIARNEERDIPTAMWSFGAAVDAALLVDTGSTDATLQAAADAFPHGLQHRVYTDASLRDADGVWKLQDFSKARNQFVEAIDGMADWLVWADADDELLSPAALRRATYDWSADVFGCWIQSGGSTWITHRMWRTGLGIRFRGRCHEYPVIDRCRLGMHDDVLILHNAAPGAGEDSNARNLRILEAEWADEPSPRTAFYLADTHRDAGRWDAAIAWYGRRIDFGEGFRDELLFAHLYRGRCLRSAGRPDAADAALAIAGELAPGWMEFVMERAHCAYAKGDYGRAIELASRAIAQPVPPTPLWREVDKYTDGPLRLISWCYEHQGKLARALEFGERAKAAIGRPDVEWDQRLARLAAATGPAVSSRKQAAIALCRPGAIGDVLTTLNLIPALREANPGLAVHYFCDPRIGRADALGALMLAAGVDLVLDSAGFGQWQQLYERAVNLVGYPLAEGYPEKPMRRHLLQYFAAEMGLDEDRGPPKFDRAITHDDLVRQGFALPALTLPQPPRPKIAPPGDYATLQVRAGWSKYKQWPRARWDEVIAALPFPVVELDEASTPKLADAVALVANARMHLGIDSFANHLTNYFWTNQRGGRRVPAVILWGSTQASAAGYPHNVNISLGLACQPCFRENPEISRQPRGPCVNPPRASYDDSMPHACMDRISVEQVIAAAREMWERTR